MPTVRIIRSAHLTIWYIVAVVILAELSEPFKALLAGLTGHHWTTKSVSALVLFAVLAVAGRRGDETLSDKTAAALARSMRELVLGTALGSLVLFFFFALHFFA